MFEDYAATDSLAKRSLWQKGGPALPMLSIELTERCNNACQHCYINLPEHDAAARARELTTLEWKAILQQAADLGVLTVLITGGEPLLREDFAELYLFTRRLGMQVMLYTNARLITPELADLFARIPPREKIEITVYGMRPASYDAVACAPGAFAQFQRGVALLRERGVPFVLKTALLPDNRADLPLLEQWAAENPWMDDPPGRAIFFDLRGRRDSAARNRLIERLRVTPAEALRVLTAQPDKYRQSMCEFCSRFMGASGDDLFNCGAGNDLTIDAYGICQPCMLLRDPRLCYDLRQGTLRDALGNFFPRLRQMKADDPAYLERCAVCFLKGLCEQCPAKSWAEHGTLDTPVEYLCQVAHAQARYLGLLAEGENAWQVTDGAERIKRMVGEEQTE